MSDLYAKLAEWLTTAHHVEAFKDDGGTDWGWQCFTCGDEAVGFKTLTAAEAGAAEHCECGGDTR